MLKYIDENEIYKLFNARGVAQLHVGDIDVLPRVEVKEVLHGRWEQHCFEIECTNCHGEALRDAFNRYVFSNYCPKCGAKMSE